MTIEVVDSPDITVTVTAPNQILVTVLRGENGLSEITADTDTDLTGVLQGNGTKVSALDNAALTTKLANDCGMATKAYADALIVGLLSDRGNFNASGNTFPGLGGGGTAGAIRKGDLWTISVPGTLGGQAVTIGDVVRALVDAPGQTASNWAITENNFGYVAENTANKSSDSALGSSNTLYPTQGAVKGYVDTGLATKQNSLGFTPLNPANNLSELPNLTTAKANLQTWIHVAATADQSVTSNQGLTNSTYLTITIPTGKRYAFKFIALYNTPAAADFRYDLNASGSPTVFRSLHNAVGNGNTSFSAIVVNTAPGVTLTPAGNGTDGVVTAEGYLHNNTGSSMTLTFRFGQNTSTASPTTLLAGSFLEYLDITT